MASESPAQEYSQNGLDGRLESALLSLKPIRDLAKNWDVDIASCLEDVLDELHLSLTQQEQTYHSDYSENSNSNTFAQAALLLQNAGHIYSRKVEYLYTLVSQTLADINSRRTSAAQRTKKSKNGYDASLDEFDHFDRDLQFMLLDDILPVSNGRDRKTYKSSIGDERRQAPLSIDLDESDNESDIEVEHLHRKESLNANLNVTRHSLQSDPGKTYLSLGGLSVTDIDRSIEASFNSLSSNHGKSRDRLSYLMKNMRNNAATTTAGRNLFHLIGNVCAISDSGALLMPGSNISAASKGYTNSGSAPVNSGPRELDFGQSNHGHNDKSVPDVYDDGLREGDDDEGDVGFQMCGDSDGHSIPDAILKSEEKKNITTKATYDHKRSRTNDPWALLDAHAPGPDKSRPLNIGVTYRLPPGLSTDGASCVTGARTRKKNTMKTRLGGRSVETFEAVLEKELRKKKRNARNGYVSFVSGFSTSLDSGSAQEEKYSNHPAEYVPIPLNGLAYGGEFLYIAKKDAQRKSAFRREKLRSKSTNEARALAMNNYCDLDESDKMSDHGFIFEGDNDDNSTWDEYSGDANNGIINDESKSNINENLFSEVFADAHNGSENEAEHCVFDEHTFEELCRAHIKAFAKGAEKYAAESQLSKRVGDWQARLVPILGEEKERPEYNLNQYRNKILEKIGNELTKRRKVETFNEDEAKTVEFDVVTGDCHAEFDVCRVFLASLMLSNSGNVILRHEEGTVTEVGALRVELLKTEIDFPTKSYGD